VVSIHAPNLLLYGVFAAGQPGPAPPSEVQLDLHQRIFVLVKNPGGCGEDSIPQVPPVLGEPGE